MRRVIWDLVGGWFIAGLLVFGFLGLVVWFFRFVWCSALGLVGWWFGGVG